MPTKSTRTPIPSTRDCAPNPRSIGTRQLGFWALARHADVLAAFKDVKRFSNRFGVSIDPSSYGPHARFGTSFLAMDPPEHTRMRGLVSRSFTPRRVREMEPQIRKLAIGYLDGLVGAGAFDMIAEFAGKLPMDVISEMLGVPAADRDGLRAWADLLVHREEGMLDVPPEGVEAFGKLRSYFKDLIADRRRRPGEDLLSALFEVEDEGDRLSESELLGFCNLMIVAGNETTTKLLANALYWLERNPEQRARIASGSATHAGVGRGDAPLRQFDPDAGPHAHARTWRSIEHRLAAESKVILLVGSANRDETVFERADEYDLSRDCSRMLSFGQGTHFCLGASLARLEGRVALEEWWKRFPDYRVEHSGIARVHSVNVRGFARLPVQV